MASASYAPPRPAPPTAAPPAPAPAMATAPAAATATLVEPAVVATADAPVLDDAAEQSWRAVLDGINARKRMLGAFLEESRFAGVLGDRAVIAMDALHRAVIEEKDNRAMLEEELARVFGRRMVLASVPPSGAGVAPAPVRRVPTAEDVRPMIEKTMAWFDAEALDGRAPQRAKPPGRERTEG